MFGHQPKPEDLKIIELKNKLLDSLNDDDPDNEEYSTRLKHLERLSDLQKHHSRPGPDWNTILLVGGNLAGVGIICFYEHAHVLASQAKSFVLKPR